MQTFNCLDTKENPLLITFLPFSGNQNIIVYTLLWIFLIARFNGNVTQFLTFIVEGHMEINKYTEPRHEPGPLT